MSHTPTPWYASKTEGKGRAYIAATGIGNVVDAGSVSHGDAAHIVRCVNAHDELVAALRAIVAAWEAVGPMEQVPESINVDELWDAARVALAKVTP